MRIQEVDLHHIGVPLRFSFTHSRASRKTTSNIIVRCVLDDGSVGYGEGVPRAYVTGESADTVWSALSNVSIARAPGTLDSLESAYEFAESMIARIGDDSGGVINNAARCALELSILDACGRRLGQHIGDGLATFVGATSGDVCPHSLVLGRERRLDRAWITEMKREFGFSAAKMKVGFDAKEDFEAVALVRELLGPDADIRLDANRGWRLQEAADFMIQAKELGVHAVEDPVVGETLGEMAPSLRELRTSHGVSIILDEPIRVLDEAREAIDLEAVDTFNIRVSKNGGLIASTRIAALAQRNGVGIQVGTQVGETAILSAAGRVLAHTVGPVRYYEGSAERLKYEREHFVSREDLTFGADATSKRLEGPGLGISILEERIRAFESRSTKRVA